MISYIQDVFDKVEPINKFFVEFGSSGVDTEGNTACLREVGFSGILFDGSATPYYESHPQDYPLKPKFPVEIEFITAENVNSVFEKHNIPKEFYFLSIDVDGEDYWIWKALEYLPQIVEIEINHFIMTTKNIVQKHNPKHRWDGSVRYGASALAMMNLANQRGYSLVRTQRPDLIFVRNDCLGNKFEDVNDIVKLLAHPEDADCFARGDKEIAGWDGYINLDEK